MNDLKNGPIFILSGCGSAPCGTANLGRDFFRGAGFKDLEGPAPTGGTIDKGEVGWGGPGVSEPGLSLVPRAFKGADAKTGLLPVWR